MRSCLHPLQNVTTFIFSLLWHINLALSLPTYHLEAKDVERRPPGGHHINNKRDPKISVSGAAGAIAGGVVGLVALALIIGLGSASIALCGSTEWSEIRGKKKEDQKKEGHDSDSESVEEDKETAVTPPRRTTDDSEETTAGTRRGTDETVTNEKAGAGRLKMSRLTLKSFMPGQFSLGNLPWGSNTNRA